MTSPVPTILPPLPTPQQRLEALPVATTPLRGGPTVACWFCGAEQFGQVDGQILWCVGCRKMTKHVKEDE
jgi:hypothetical protein